MSGHSIKTHTLCCDGNQTISLINSYLLYHDELSTAIQYVIGHVIDDAVTQSIQITILKTTKNIL